MSDLLAETVKHRDYSLTFRWGCREHDCPSPTTTIFLHRTDAEVKNFIRNINQICGIRHITKPLKQCTKCFMVFSLETDTCIHCEPRARKRAQIAIQIEAYEKELKHLKDETSRTKLNDIIITFRNELESIV